MSRVTLTGVQTIVMCRSRGRAGSVVGLMSSGSTPDLHGCDPGGAVPISSPPPSAARRSTSHAAPGQNTRVAFAGPASQAIRINVPAMSDLRGVADLVRNGGRLCLDFANTVEPRTGPVARDWLIGFPDLIEWAQHGGILDDRERAALLCMAAARPADAKAAFQDAIALREALFGLFAAIVDGAEPADADLTALRDGVAAATRLGRLTPRAGGFHWSWDVTTPAPQSERCPVTDWAGHGGRWQSRPWTSSPTDH